MARSSLLSKIKDILLIALIILAFAAGYFLHKPQTVAVTEYKYVDVDSVKIIQMARHGFIKYDKSALIREFGSIYKDTALVFIDSLSITDSVNIIDSVSIAYMKADTSLFFEKEDNNASFNLKILLKQEAFWAPIYAFRNDIIVKDVNFKIKQPKLNWYEKREYWGIGGLLLGGAFGLSVR